MGCIKDNNQDFEIYEFDYDSFKKSRELLVKDIKKRLRRDIGFGNSIKIVYQQIVANFIGIIANYVVNIIYDNAKTPFQKIISELEKSFGYIPQNTEQNQGGSSFDKLLNNYFSEVRLNSLKAKGNSYYNISSIPDFIHHLTEYFHMEMTRDELFNSLKQYSLIPKLKKGMGLVKELNGCFLVKACHEKGYNLEMLKTRLYSYLFPQLVLGFFQALPKAIKNLTLLHQGRLNKYD